MTSPQPQWISGNSTFRQDWNCLDRTQLKPTAEGQLELSGTGYVIVYVDSGSTDGSVEYAQSQGADVVNLDLSIPFTAARARNSGFEIHLQRQPDLEYVQFIDGDCILAEGLAQNRNAIYGTTSRSCRCLAASAANFTPAIQSTTGCAILNLNQPAGETAACGGDAMFRVEPYKSVYGFNAALLCGEEPDLWLAFAPKGLHVWRLADTMTFHDAAILHFSQYWKRAVSIRLWKCQIGALAWARRWTWVDKG